MSRTTRRTFRSRGHWHPQGLRSKWVLDESGRSDHLSSRQPPHGSWANCRGLHLTPRALCAQDNRPCPSFQEYNTEGAFSAAVLLSFLAVGTLIFKELLGAVASAEKKK